MILKRDRDAMVERLGNIAAELGNYEFWAIIDKIREAQRLLRRKHTVNRRRGEKEHDNAA